MRRILPIPPVPPPLAPADPASVGSRERARLETHIQQTGSSKGFTFKAYKHPDVVRALEEVFQGKCAYCEHRYDSGAPCDVEHYRPKGGVEIAGELKLPYYYWLASEWTNLLPSCVDCNRERYHAFADDEEEFRGKANKFPIANPAQRAAKPGEEIAEQRLLLHPYYDDPAEHLVFIEDGVIRAVNSPGGAESAMGVESIKTYGLDRPKLTHARRDVYVRVKGYVELVKRAAKRRDEHPGEQGYQDAFDDAVEALTNEINQRAPYLTMLETLTEPLKKITQ